MIIEVVGVDGSGKTTAIHGARRAVTELGHAWAYERSFQSENVRMLEAAASVSGIRKRPTAAFSADVIETARTLELVAKSLALATYKGSTTQHVFCDSYVVEQAARLIKLGLADTPHRHLLEQATPPDLCVYLSVQPGEALRRMRERLKGDALLLASDPDTATSAVIESLEQALTFVQYPHVPVDAGQDLQTVLDKVMAALSLLNKDAAS